MINLDLPWNPAVLEQRIARIYRLGQERNVQVINLVAKDTIEEQMLDKLRFKTAMFEGVLDNGEDTIFLGNETKFTAMMDTLGEALDDEKTEGKVTVQTSTDDVSDEPEPVQEEESVQEEPVKENDSVKEKPESPNPPKELVAQGISFLSGLAATLKSPEATAQLVETLVETDAKTGKTSLRIPVPDKQTVRNLLDIVGKLFG